MRARLWKVGRGLLWLLLIPFRILIWPFWQLALLGGRALRWSGRQLWATIKAISRLIWEFWEPIHELLVYYFLNPFQEAWQGIGRMGLALRHLLVAFIWQPVVWITAPLRWLLRQLWRFSRWLVWQLWRFSRWLVGQLWRFCVWMGHQLGRLFIWLVVRPLRYTLFLVYRWWRAGRPGRQRLRRQWISRWTLWQARFWLALRRPQPPLMAIVAPSAPRPETMAVGMRPARLVATLLTINVVLVGLSFMVNQLNAQGTPTPNHLAGFTAVPPTPTQANVTPDAAAPPPDMAVAANRIKPTVTPWPLPDPLALGGSIVFTRRSNGNSDIYALTIGQPGLIRLTNDPAEDRDPVWSPDGRMVAFASNRGRNWDIYIINLQEGELLRLTNDTAFDGGPAWSPDSQFLVFESYRSGNLDLFIVKADGSDLPIRLTEHPAPDYSPHWGPDGRHIAFTSWRSGNKDIYIMSLDAVSDNRAANITNTPDKQEDNPVFSPDGAFISYDDNSPGFDRISAIPLANYQPDGAPITLGQGKHATWSPSGRDLLYVHQEPTESFLIASSFGGFGVTTQAYAHPGELDDPNWSAIVLAQHLELHGYLREVAQAQDAPLFLEAVAQPQQNGPPYLVYELPINAPSPFLSDRVDQAFMALRERILRESGWDFLGQMDNMFEPLNTPALPGMTDRTWNKAGRAFDFRYAYVLTFDPQVEIVREDLGVQVYWHVFLRTTAQDGTMGEPLRDIPWDFRARYGADPQYYDEGGVRKETIPAGYYLDFTLMASDFGWTRIPSAENWRAYFPGIRFWHFENYQGLDWEQAMLEVYTAEEILAVFNRR
ncbi:MAG: DPP IV N-terminal domain-containing protein [Candidatus Promineifilaceae bacterium]